jgi:hypothetical protein
MAKLSKILSIVLYIILGVTLVFAGLFYFGDEVEGAAFTTPEYTETFLNWAKILVVGAAGLAIIFEIVNLILNPKNAVRTLISIVILGVIVLVAYSMGDGTPLNIVGYKGSDNVPSMLILGDTFLYTTYILIGGVLLSILYTEVSRLFR